MLYFLDPRIVLKIKNFTKIWKNFPKKKFKFLNWKKFRIWENFAFENFEKIFELKKSSRLEPLDNLRLHLKSDLTAFETFSWMWYCIFSTFLTKSVSASIPRWLVRSAKWVTRANNRGGFSWTWSSFTKLSNEMPHDPFDVMREFIRSISNECLIRIYNQSPTNQKP